MATRATQFIQDLKKSTRDLKEHVPYTANGFGAMFVKIMQDGA